VQNTANTDRLFIVIPVFNRWTQTRRCIDALKSGSTRTSPIIVVVDHGSTDDTATALQREYPEVTRLAEDASLWWTGATNRGIVWALEQGASRVMLLNNDAYLEEHAIDLLIGHATRHPNAVITALPRDLATGRDLGARATTCFLLGFPTLRLPALPLGKTSEPLVPTRLILGGRGVVIPRAVFEDVGLFDESRLPHYGADHDFYLRCRKRGVPLFVARDASVYIDAATTSRASNLGSLSAREFYTTLSDPRSHRNLATLVALFRKHYPIPGLYGLGVGLNLARYLMIYLVERTFFLARRR
jgi:GT2 family glycosyltransferase